MNKGKFKSEVLASKDPPLTSKSAWFKIKSFTKTFVANKNASSQPILNLEERASGLVNYSIKHG